MSENKKPHGDKPIASIPEVIIAQAEAVAGSNPDGATQAPSESMKEQTHKNDASPQDGSAGPSTSQAGQERPIEQRPPPMYGKEYGQVNFDQDGLGTQAKVANDGRLNIHIHQKSRRLSDLLVPALRSQLNLQHADISVTRPQDQLPPSIAGTPDQRPPPLNIVIHVVGSRGDVQPFIALGKVLRETHGHRVRLATHSTFKSFVEENGLEYFNIGGDPAELMAFMVKNPGLMPGMDSLKSGDVGKRRKGMYDILQGCWRSCFEAGDGTGVPIADDAADGRSSIDSGIGMDSNASAQPFVADAIIANPPSFAHIHCAEKLGIPLHLMFTMPWSPTQAFPHPLANIQSSNADTSLTNFISYALVEIMTWQGLGDMINRFREKSLGLEPVSLMWAPGMASRLKIPYTYCWSPALIPKPKDWGPHISISGFYFLSLASSYTPEPDLQAFLDSGPPPVYIGFGSIVVDDPEGMTSLIFEAVKQTGQRALVSKGWGGFGADDLGIPENIFMLGNVPHDWLFKRVSCVVHHGGAGTTAAGIALSKPTVIVPFFGDQPFWGAMVAKAGAGPKPIPSKELTAEHLAAGILEALKPTTLSRAQELGARIMSERGSENGVNSFHKKLDLPMLRCSLAPRRAAVWRVKRTQLRLSAFAATTLGNEGLLDFNEIKLYRSKEYDSEDGPWDPISGGASALIGSFGSILMGFADFPVEILRALKIRPANKAEDSQASPNKSANSSTEPETSADSVVPTGSLSPTQTAVSGHASPELDEETITPSTSKDSNCAPRAMASALRGSMSRSSSRSRSPSRTSSPSRSSVDPRISHHRSNSGHITLDAAMGAGKGISRVVGASVKSPMDFTLSVARGFHNAPKLYGDETVRHADKVTGFQSGLRAAGKEFGYGMYDGVTGVFTQPIDGAKKGGVAGFLKGVGKGVGGFLLKPAAAFWGIPGYTAMGVYKELQKHFGSSVQNYIVAARTAQGFHEWTKSTTEERLEVISQWQAAQVELNKQRQHGHHLRHHEPVSSSTEHLMKGEAGAKSANRKTTIQKGHTRQDPIPAPEQKGSSTDIDAVLKGNSNEFEEAIQASVAATSKGNPEEDQLVERAIRASVMELQSASQAGGDEEALQQAIQASIAEAKQARPNLKTQKGDGEEQVRQSDTELQHNLAKPKCTAHGVGRQNRNDFDDSGIDTDDDDKNHNPPGSKPNTGHESHIETDSDLKKTIELSRKSHEDHLREIEKLKNEEDIVLSYVKRQSALEDEHRLNLAKPEPGTQGATQEHPGG